MNSTDDAPVGLLERLAASLRPLLTVEVLVGALAVVLLILPTSPVRLGFCLGLLLVFLLSVRSGSYGLLAMSTLLLLTAASALEDLSSFGPKVNYELLLAYCLLAYVQHEMVRVSWWRRREAVVRPAALQHIFIGLGLVIGLSALGLLVLLLSGNSAFDDQRSWLWVPLTATCLLVAAFVLVWLPARSATTESQRRWEPGLRLPPQPTGFDDLTPDAGSE